jgi:hypothetical protein
VQYWHFLTRGGWGRDSASCDPERDALTPTAVFKLADPATLLLQLQVLLQLEKFLPAFRSFCESFDGSSLSQAPYIEQQEQKKQSRPATRHGGAWGERKCSSYSFLISALNGGEWSSSRPGRALPPWEWSSGTHWRGGWLGPRAGLDTEARGKFLYLCRGSNPV